VANNGPSFPLPIGVTASFSPVAAGISTGTSALDAGGAVMTYQPLDVNDAGTVTLYDSAANVIGTLTAGGYLAFMVPAGGKSYYMNATKGAQLLAITLPNSLRY